MAFTLRTGADAARPSGRTAPSAEAIQTPLSAITTENENATSRPAGDRTGTRRIGGAGTCPWRPGWLSDRVRVLIPPPPEPVDGVRHHRLAGDSVDSAPERA